MVLVPGKIPPKNGSSRSEDGRARRDDAGSEERQTWLSGSPHS